MYPTVTFGDIEAAAIDHVRTALATETVVSQIPAVRPALFVSIFRTGGPKVSPVTENAQLTVEAWGDSKTAAHDLAQAARTAIHDMRGRALGAITVARVSEFGGPAWLPDPTSTQARYTFTVQVLARALPAA